MSFGEINLQPRDEKMLDHIGRYRVTLRPVLDHLFFCDESSGCGNVIKRLLASGYITAREGLPAKRRYYQLTAVGAEGRVPLGRTKPMRAQSLRSALAILWFCAMNETPRLRLETWELRDILDADLPAGKHCAQPGDPLKLFRVQIPSGRTKTAGVINALKDHLEESFTHAVIKRWAKDRRYGFAILAEAERVPELRAAVAKHGLNRYASILVEPVPSPQTLTRALHEHRVSQDSR